MTRPGAKVASSWTLTSGPSRYVVLSTVHEPSAFLAKASHGKAPVAACALEQQACNAIAAAMANATRCRMIDLHYPVGQLSKKSVSEGTAARGPPRNGASPARRGRDSEFRRPVRSNVLPP